MIWDEAWLLQASLFQDKELLGEFGGFGPRKPTSCCKQTLHSNTQLIDAI